MAATSRPGAISLLDKYASINSSIDDARRRVAEVRSGLERSNERIQVLREERKAMISETENARVEATRMEAALVEAKAGRRARLAEKEGAQRDLRLAESERDAARRRMDEERNAFLERCRDFRASCRRMRATASILVLEGGNFDAKDASDEADLWRRLQEEEFSDDEEEDDEPNDDRQPPRKRKRNKADPEMDQAEKDEKESRQALIEAECALHAVRSENADAIRGSNARTQRLTQQRAQLQRHRKEVEELEREIMAVKDDVVSENQLANTFEKECKKREQMRITNTGASRNAHRRASYSSGFNPPDEPNQGNSHRSYITPNQNESTSGYHHHNRGAVVNPYTKQASCTPRAPAGPAPRGGAATRHDPKSSRREGSIDAPRHASDILHGATPPQFGQQRRPAQQHTAQHPHRGRQVRNQRQFGTTVGVSLSDGMTDELKECMAAFAQPSLAPSTSSKKTDDNEMSDISDSSDDEELLSFNIFGKK